MKKRILIVAPSLQIGGGAEKNAFLLGQSLAKEGLDITTLVFYDKDNSYKQKKIISFREMKSGNIALKITKLIKRALRISKICRKLKIDSIVSFTEECNFSVVLSRLIFNNPAKIIVSIRTNPEIQKKKIGYNILIRRLYKYADRVVAVSKQAEELLRNEFGIKKAVTIYNLHNIREYQIQAKESIPLKYEKIFKKRFVFINVGRTEEPKGQWYLLRIFKEVYTHKKNVRLVIIGDGSLKKKLKELAKRLEISKAVIFLGNVNNIFPYLIQSNCFVFTSIWEGLPNTIIEALSVGLPVISTDCKTGPREILCPDIPINEKIVHPLYGKYGILTMPFKREIFFETLKERPLCNGEKMMAHTMLSCINKEENVKKYDPSNSFERALFFDTKKIIREWINIL